MADTITPRRRSARLKGNNNNTPGRSRSGTPAQKRLGSLLEQDETPVQEAQQEALVNHTTPMGKKRMPGAFDADVEMKTPESVQQPKPDHEKMHPEHAHQNIVRVSNAGLELGFSDVNPYQSSPLRPTHREGLLSPDNVAHPKSSPGFDFSFNRNRKDLSNEAQRIMDSVREEAARIKEKMRRERDEQARKNLEAEGITGRRFAKPKSRFSDAHDIEFKKMQSIADHVSVLKNKFQPRTSPFKESTPVDQISSPSKPTAIPRTPVKTGLKRSRSKMDLDTPIEDKLESRSSLKRPASRNLLGSLSPTKKSTLDSSRPANPAPAKRRKFEEAKDVSAMRPTSSGAGSASVSPKKPGIPSAASTPTKASMARLQTAKTVQENKKSRFGFSRSNSLKSVTKPGESLRTASDRIASAVADKVKTVKSILHKPAPKYSDDPLKIAAGTHIPLVKSTPSTHQGTPSLPGTPRPSHMLPRPTPKRVEFAPDTKAASESIASPTPAKKPSIRLLSGLDDESAESTSTRSPVSNLTTVSYPKLPDPPKGPLLSVSDSPKQRPSPRQVLSPLSSHPPTGKDFTFSHEKQIVFAGNSASPKRHNSTSSNTTPTSIRQVRPSGMHTPTAHRTLPVGSASFFQKPLPAVPHGMTNKKRAREGGDDSGSDVENRDPVESVVSITGEGSPRKRAKMAAGVDSRAARGVSPFKSPVKSPAPNRLSPAKSSPLKTPRRQTGFGAGGPATTTPKKGLSLARINFLSRPKERR